MLTSVLVYHQHKFVQQVIISVTHSSRLTAALNQSGAAIFGSYFEYRTESICHPNQQFLIWGHSSIRTVLKYIKKNPKSHSKLK